jgi:methyl-accepting chemotaxis protein
VNLESWGIALVVLAAVLLGAAIPALVQTRATLRALESVLRRSGPRLDEALEAATGAAGRLDRLVSRLEENGRIEQLVDGIAAVSRTVSQLRDTVRVASAVGAAVGPAIAAAVHAFRDGSQAAPSTPSQIDDVESGADPPESRKQALS